MAKVSRQVEFVVDGESYPVALTVNSLCGLEDEFGGRSITAIGDEIAAGTAGARGVRALFRAALVEGHPDITPMQAGRLVSELGAGRASEIIQQAFEAVQAGLDEDPQDLPSPDARGRLKFEALGERMTLAFHMNAQAELEDYFDGLSPEEIARKIGKREISLRDLRAMFRAALIDDRELSLEAAGDLMNKIGLRVVGSAVAEAFVGAFPEAADEMQDDGKPQGNRRTRRAAARKHPTKKPPKGGTGKR